MGYKMYDNWVGMSQNGVMVYMVLTDRNLTEFAEARNPFSVEWDPGYCKFE